MFFLKLIIFCFFIFPFFCCLGFTLEEDDEFKLFCQTQYIIYFIKSLLKEYKNVVCAIPGQEKMCGSNPYYHQTKLGLFLGYFNGYPSSLWTPWGYVNLFQYKCGNMTLFIEDLFSQIEVELYREEIQGNDKYRYGPVYRIIKVKNEDIPYAKEKERKDYIELWTIDNIWRNLDARYKKEVNVNHLTKYECCDEDRTRNCHPGNPNYMVIIKQSINNNI